MHHKDAWKMWPSELLYVSCSWTNEDLCREPMKSSCHSSGVMCTAQETHRLDLVLKELYQGTSASHFREKTGDTEKVTSFQREHRPPVNGQSSQQQHLKLRDYIVMLSKISENHFSTLNSMPSEQSIKYNRSIKTFSGMPNLKNFTSL